MANKEPIHIGLLFSDTGVTSPIERSQLQGTLFAISEINSAGGIDGREIVPIRYDPQSIPSRHAELAERLFLIDRVNVIFGCYMSSTRKAVLPIVERFNRLLFYPTLYEGYEFSNNLIYTGAAPNQNSVQLADYMTTHFGRRVCLVGSNYIYPIESNRIMADLVRQRNGEVVGEVYIPLDAGMRDFAAVVKEIRDKAPSFIFSTVVGQATKYLYEAYAEAGLSPKEMPIASLTTCEVEVNEMGGAVAAGHFTAAPYFQSIQSDANTRVLDAYAAWLRGAPSITNQCWEAAYFQLHLYANAYRAAGSDEISLILPELLGVEFDAPQGKIRIDPDTHHTWLYPRIGRANQKGQFTLVREATRAVRPDPYLVSYSIGDWTTQPDQIDA